MDIKPVDQWYQNFPDVKNLGFASREEKACKKAFDSARTVYHFAGDMGGMRCLELHREENTISMLLNTHLFPAAIKNRVRRFYYPSSACIYNAEKQTNPAVAPLQEANAYPAAGDRVLMPAYAGTGRSVNNDRISS
ncbi:MAG: NAD-dependent epimerase/dehydratase family protein [Phycisphaerae bacterium]